MFYASKWQTDRKEIYFFAYLFTGIFQPIYSEWQTDTKEIESFARFVY